jgi:hypothetical protein
MSDVVKISQLTAIPAAMDGSELAPWVQNGTTYKATLADLVGALKVRNETGGTLTAGTLVYVSSWSEAQTRFLIAKADANAAGARATYVLTADIANNANGTVSKGYRLANIDTSGTTIGDPWYLLEVAGTSGKTAPTSANAIVQAVGRVAVVDAATGVVVFNIDANNQKTIGSNELQALAVGTAALAAGAVTAAKLADAIADALVVFTVAAAAEAAHKRILTIQAKDVQGNNLAVATQFWLELVSAADASYAVSDDGAGSITFNNATSKRTLIITDATGLAEVGITDTAAETIKVAIGGGPACPFTQGPAVLSLVFAG